MGLAFSQAVLQDPDGRISLPEDLMLILHGHCVFDSDSFLNLASTSKTMREALRLWPVQVSVSRSSDGYWCLPMPELLRSNELNAKIVGVDIDTLVSYNAKNGVEDYIPLTMRLKDVQDNWFDEKNGRVLLTGHGVAAALAFNNYVHEFLVEGWAYEIIQINGERFANFEDFRIKLTHAILDDPEVRRLLLDAVFDRDCARVLSEDQRARISKIIADFSDTGCFKIHVRLCKTLICQFSDTLENVNISMLEVRAQTLVDRVTGAHTNQLPTLPDLPSLKNLNITFLGMDQDLHHIEEPELLGGVLQYQVENDPWKVCTGIPANIEKLKLRQAKHEIWRSHNIAQWYRFPVDLQLFTPPHINALRGFWLPRYGDLKELVLGDVHFPNLRDAVYLELPRNLEVLELTGDPTIQSPALTRQRDEDVGLKELKLHDKLESLSLSYMPRLCVKSLPDKLKTLVLHSVHRLAPEELPESLVTCELTKVAHSLSKFPGTTEKLVLDSWHDRLLDIPHLKYVQIGNVKVITLEEVIPVAENLRVQYDVSGVTHVSLSGCHTLHQINFVEGPLGVQRVNLVSLPSLVELNLVQNIRHLDLIHLPELRKLEIPDKITNIRIDNLYRLESLIFPRYSLPEPRQNVMITECDNLQKVAFASDQRYVQTIKLINLARLVNLTLPELPQGLLSTGRSLELFSIPDLQTVRIPVGFSNVSIAGAQSLLHVWILGQTPTNLRLVALPNLQNIYTAVRQLTPAQDAHEKEILGSLKRNGGGCDTVWNPGTNTDSGNGAPRVVQLAMF